MGRADRGHGRHARLGGAGGALAHGLRHVGDRLQVRGGDRARARRRGHARRAPRRRRAAVRPRLRRAGQAARRARRPDHPHLPDHRLLQRPRRGGRGRRRGPAALLRRRLAGEQGAGRQAVLADPGDGGRVPRRGALRDRRGRRRREHHHPRRGHGDGPAGDGGGGRGDAGGRGRDPAVPGRHRAQRQQGRLALRGADGVDQPCPVPDAARAGRRQPGAGRRSGRCSRS